MGRTPLRGTANPKRPRWVHLCQVARGVRKILNATQHLFEALRHAGHQPRLVFTSSVAVFGAPFLEMIPVPRVDRCGLSNHSVAPAPDRV
jgi:nucleoside-diphosphate-sugar epimerase